MKQINTPQEVSKALSLPKKKYNYTKKTGRPAKTLADLPKNWKDIIVKGSLIGKTESEIRRDICIAKGKNTDVIQGLWYALKEREDEFRHTLNSCQIYRQAWWEEQGRKSLKRHYFQGATWYSIMKNCFGYKDRTEIEHGLTDETWDKYKKLPISEIKNRVAALLD